VAAFLTFQHGSLVVWGYHASHNRTIAATEAAIARVLSLGPHPGLNTLVFVPNRNLHRPLLSLTKHKYLPQATSFTSALQMLCFIHPSVNISIYPLSVKLSKKPMRTNPHIFTCDWPGPQTKDCNLAELRAEAQLHHLPENHPPPSLKSLPFCLWKEDQDSHPNPPPLQVDRQHHPCP